MSDAAARRNLGPVPALPLAGATLDHQAQPGSRAQLNVCSLTSLCLAVCAVLVLGIWALHENPLVMALKR